MNSAGKPRLFSQLSISLLADHRYRAGSGGSKRIDAPPRPVINQRGVRVFFQQRNVSQAEMINGSQGESGKGRTNPAAPESRA